MKEALLQLGFTEEQVEQIIGTVNKSTEYVPKGVFNNKLDEIKSLKGQLDDRDKQLNDLKTKAGDNEKLAQQIQQLQDENKANKKAYEDGVLLVRKEVAVKSYYGDNVYDFNDVKNNLDFNKIKINDNGEIIDGFKEQDEQLRNSKPHYFKQVNSPQPNDNEHNFFGLPLGQGMNSNHYSSNKQEDVIKQSLEMVDELFPSKKQ